MAFSAHSENHASAKRYLAHVRQDDDGSFVIHDLEEHLRAVAKGAEGFAASFGGSDWGRLAGLWHDLAVVILEGFPAH